MQRYQSYDKSQKLQSNVTIMIVDIYSLDLN